METVIKKYKNYEDYLDSLIIEEDQRYLQDIEIARQIVKLGYRFRVNKLYFVLPSTLTICCYLLSTSYSIEKRYTPTSPDITDFTRIMENEGFK